MKLIRLFIAILLPSSLQQEISRIQQEIKKSGVCHGSYPAPETAHLTLQFIGSVKEDALVPITKALQSITFSPFEISFTAFDYFSRHGSPSILYLTTKSQELPQLAQEVTTAVQPWISPNEHDFVGHLTLMRIKNKPDEEKVAEFIPTLALKPLSFKANSFSLMQSELGPNGPIYSELMRIPLK